MKKKYKKVQKWKIYLEKYSPPLMAPQLYSYQLGSTWYIQFGNLKAPDKFIWLWIRLLCEASLDILLPQIKITKQDPRKLWGEYEGQ